MVAEFGPYQDHDSLKDQQNSHFSRQVLHFAYIPRHARWLAILFGIRTICDPHPGHTDYRNPGLIVYCPQQLQGKITSESKAPSTNPEELQAVLPKSFPRYCVTHPWVWEEPQDHRIFWAGRDPQASSIPRARCCEHTEKKSWEQLTFVNLNLLFLKFLFHCSIWYESMVESPLASCRDGCVGKYLYSLLSKGADRQLGNIHIWVRWCFIACCIPYKFHMESK